VGQGILSGTTDATIKEQEEYSSGVHSKVRGGGEGLKINVVVSDRKSTQKQTIQSSKLDLLIRT
jgi:hypothetical protein